MGEKPSRRSPNHPPGLHLRLFGPLELCRSGRILPPLATRKTQSLFAYLVLHRATGQPREKLAALFWGDQTDLRARRSLATALWRIRTALPASCLVVDVNSIQFDPDSSFWLDVAEFDRHLQAASQEADAERRAQHWREAVTLYRGDLLEGFYEDWCVEERYRLETLYLDALKRLVAHSEAHADWESVHVYAERYLARDPLEASLYLATMRAWVAVGKVNEARRRWQMCCDTWQKELHSVPPSELTQQAAVTLGAQFASPAPESPAPIAAQRRGSLDAPPFVGRARELNALHGQWLQVVQCQGTCILVGGEAGVGKTRLLDEFATRVRYQGGLIARGRCWEPERKLAYQPLVEILQELNLDSSFALPAWARHELAHLLPDLEHGQDHARAETHPNLRLGQSALLNAIATALSQAAQQAPLLVILEDLHAASDSTLAAFSFLARQVTHTRTLLVVSYRTEEVDSGSALGGLLLQLVRDSLAIDLPLERLGPDAAAELVQRVRGNGATRELAAQLYEHTQGNPLFLIETLRAMQETGSTQRIPVPAGVSQLIDRRLCRIGPHARELIACAAVAGQAFDFDVVSSAASQGEERALEGMDELLRRGFVREGSGTSGQDYEFEHPIIRQVVYSGLHHRRKRRLHRLVGEALERADRPRQALAAGQMAYHFDRAEIGDKALDYAVRAVDVSWDLGTPSEVAHYSEMALYWLERIGADRFGAEAALSKAFDLRLEQEEALDILGRHDEQATVLQAMSDLAERLGDGSRRALVHIRRFWFCYRTDAQQAYAHAESALALAQEQGNHSALVQAQYIVALAWAALGEPARGLSFAQDAVAGARALQDQVLEGWSLLQLGYIYKQMADYGSAHSALGESAAVNRTRGNLYALSRTLLHLGDVHRKLGDATQARQDYEQALALGREVGFVWAEQDALKRLGEMPI